MQLYFIRHAQSENNVIWAQTGSENGRVPDPEVTEIGHQQAAHLATYLADVVVHNPFLDKRNNGKLEFTHLYCSLMSRAAITASYISKECHLPMIAWEEIHESGGIFEINPETNMREGLPGHNRAYFEKRFPNLKLPDSLGCEGWWKRPFEQPEQMDERAHRVMQELLQRHGGTDDKVAMVSHAGFGQNLLRVLLDFNSPNKTLDPKMKVWFSIQNTSISCINFEPDYFNIVYLNQTQHLPAELVT